ncbi:MAG TPA: DUF3089 domain-containing protein [Acidimicrobiales bacterium]|nr:DUF3089 domain-containing protein [Acidimicrobiales bacterium]
MRRPKRPCRSGLALVAVIVAVAACSSPVHRPAATGTTRAASGAAERTDAAGTVWLCRPGVAPDPCTGNLSATAVSAGGTRAAVPASPAVRPGFDCFYVYPTVSPEKGPNADLTIQDSETGVAKIQAERFSQVCDVWAPMYRQVTLSALFAGGLPALNTAYQSLLGTWNDYLHNYNDGRPIIFVGHSQGAAMLIRLLANEVDPSPTLRARTVVAIIVGGNVQVAAGKQEGGSFQHLPLCTSESSTGCVIAYSTFPSEPPAGSFFGRPGQGVSLMSLQTARSGQQVACVDPAALAGGTGTLDPYYPSPPVPKVGTPWVTYPGLYSASCESAAGATWLQVNHVATAGDTRPVVTESLGPLWGYHVDDIQLTLGNLVDDVRTEEAAYAH